MIDISVHELNKYYGANHVIQGVSFEIYRGEKVGLLGQNGSGKTTLFRVIAEDESYESGTVTKATGKQVQVLAQIPVFAKSDTVEGILRSSFAEITAVHQAMQAIEGDGDPAVLERYGNLMDEYERLGGYDVEVKLEKICNGMNIGEPLRRSPFCLLSGGEKTRVNLARILLRDCDILLLDEPTNHLDLASLAWLEQFIRDFPGTVVVISHDRASSTTSSRASSKSRTGKRISTPEIIRGTSKKNSAGSSRSRSSTSASKKKSSESKSGQSGL